MSPSPTREHDHERPAAEAHRAAAAPRPPTRRSASEPIRKISEAHQRVGLAGGVHRREVEAEADRGEHARARRPPPPAARRPSWCSCEASATPTSAHAMPGELRRSRAGRRWRSRRRPARSPRRRRSARRRPSPRSPCRGSRRTARASPRARPGSRAAPPRRRGGSPRAATDDRDRREPAELRPEQHAQRSRACGACHGPTKSATPQARLAPSASSKPRFTRRAGWPRSRRAGSRGRARPPRPSAPRARRGAPRRSGGARPAAPRVRPSARSSIRRRPRWTCPSRRPSSVGANAGPARRARASGRRRARAPPRAAGRARSRGWSCAVSRQSVATPTVCSSRPPA